MVLGVQLYGAGNMAEASVPEEFFIKVYSPKL